jgi:amidohydrolase
MDHLSSEFHDWLAALRRRFHRIPEPYFQEQKTAAAICEVLDELQVPYDSGVAGTGVAARLKADRPGPVLAFRADMDALPIQEAGDRGYQSQHDGFMHACGHDGHMTIALGIMRRLQQQQWPRTGRGEVIFFFQPAEEEGAGAKAMLDTGRFDSDPVAAIFAGHLTPELPVGHVELISGTAHAATNTLKIRIKGKGGHGATPHLCIDPIVAAAHLIIQLQVFVSRNLSPFESAVLTIGEFHAGTASNIIPEEVRLNGTLRTLSPQVRREAIDRVEAMLRGLELAFGVEVEFRNLEGYPVQINDADLVEFVASLATQQLGAKAVHLSNPHMGAEDFGYFCRKWPGVMVGLGCHNPDLGFQHALHSPHFDMDERVLDVGVRFFSDALVRYMQETEGRVPKSECGRGKQMAERPGDLSQ